LPETLGRSGSAVRQVPARVAASSCGTARTVASSSAKAWSATQLSLVPAPLATAMPRARAWATAIFSKPAPSAHTSSSAGIASISAAVRPVEPMVSTARMRSPCVAICAARPSASGA
jgi:hypothetical protein